MLLGPEPDRLGAVLAILAPGQGAQRQGFLEAWLAIDGVREHLERHSAATGIDLIAAGTTMSDEQITDTAIAQPLIVSASMVTAALLPTLPRGAVFAGHSVGEFAASALAGAVSEDDAMRLVATRGAAMARASASPASGMTAILGGDPAEVTAAIAAAGCFVANHNANGQIVAAGTKEALAVLAENPPARARLRPLAVAGAFHTALMASAKAEIAAAAAAVTTHDTAPGVLTNSDGTLLHDGAEILARLVSQVCRPVRWDLCMQTIDSMGVTAVIELAPAGTLTALIRRELPDVATLALRSPEDLDDALALVSEHAAELTDHTVPWQLLVAPAKGTVRVSDTAIHSPVVPGDVVVHVVTRSDDLEVQVVHPGQLIEWLVHDGDPVNEGQPLARISAEVFA
jgi:[acyl-carrier-protein] S-malonyltransferase